MSNDRVLLKDLSIEAQFAIKTIESMGIQVVGAGALPDRPETLLWIKPHDTIKIRDMMKNLPISASFQKTHMFDPANPHVALDEVWLVIIKNELETSH